MLLLSNAIAFVAAAFLLIEWRSLREDFLCSFALGFLSIVIGCTLAPLRMQGDFVIGVWLSNSMVPLAHMLFLHGTAAFVGRRLGLAWVLSPLVCSALMAIPLPGDRDQIMSFLNAACVALLSLRAATLLYEARHEASSETRMLLSTFIAHGSFYTIKALCAFAPGAFIDLSSYSGAIIPLSLFEGILVEVALAMSIAGALRRRREDRANRIAESDPLTGLLNRRGFEARTAAALPGGGTLLLIDVDNFKTINDGFGHQEGDRLLVTLADFLRTDLPAGAIAARLGGDEFAVLLPSIGSTRGLSLAETLCTGFAARRGADRSGTLSIGCAAFAPQTRDLFMAESLADRALYDAKRAGRNRARLAVQAWENQDPARLSVVPRAAAG